MFIVNPFRFAATGYQPSGALYLDGSADILTRTPSREGNRKKFTVSVWFKRLKLGTLQYLFAANASGPVDFFYASFDANDKLRVIFQREDDTAQIDWLSTQVFQDTTSWANLVVAVDSSIASPTFKVFYNGSEITAWTKTTDSLSQNEVSSWNAVRPHAIGARSDPTYYSSFMMADVINLDGTASSDATEFGETDSTTGIWIPKDPSELTFGDNGFWLNFSDARYPGLDYKAGSTGEESTISFLHHFAGDDGDTHTAGDASTRAAKDSSSRNHSMTYFGNAQIDTAQSKFSGSSVYFDGAGDGITVNNASDAFTFPGDFTIEMWVRFPAINTSSGQAGANSQLITNRTSGSNYWSLQWEWLSSIGVRFYVLSGGSVTANMQQGSNSGWSTDTWYHVAVVRHGGTVNIYRDGTSIASSTAFGTGSIGGYNDVTLGNYTSSTSGDGSFYGWMDELRISKRAVYKANFTAPSAAFSDPPAGNHFTPASIGANNIVVDGPVNSDTKEITVYPSYDADNSAIGSSVSFANNNLAFTNGTGGSWRIAPTNLFLSSGKYYFEVVISSISSANIGVATSEIGSLTADLGVDAYGWGYENGGNKKNGNSSSSYGNSYTSENVVQVAIDLDNKAIYFGEDNTWQNSGDPTSGSSKTNAAFTNSDNSFGDAPVMPVVALHTAGTATIRFDSSSWSHSAPTGYDAITSTVTGTGNAATWNVLQWEGNSDNSPVPVFSEGNLRIKNTSAVGACSFVGTVKMYSGKFYWEVTCNATSTGVTDGYPYIGVIRDDEPSNFPKDFHAIANTYGSQQGYAVDNTGSKWVSGTETTSFMSSYSAGDTISIALDLDNRKIWFGRNGVYPSSGDPAGGSNEAYSSIPTGYGWFPHSTEYNNSDTTANFGQKPFKYTVPTGFNAGILTHNITSGYTGSLSNAIVTTNATEANIKSTTESAHSFSNWISILYNRDASEQRIFYASDDSSNYIPFCDDGVLGKNSFPTLSGSNNWTGCAIATGASTGIATGTISHSTNGSSDSTAAHGLTSSTSRFSILISSEATSGHDGWFWFHPAMSSGNNIRMAQGGSEAQQSSKYYAEVTSSNAVVKSAAPNGTYRYIVFAENDLISLYSYTNMGSDSHTGIFVNTNNKPEWMLWSQMTETGGGYGSHLAWKGTHNPYNPWTKYTRLHNISTNELTENGAIITANGFQSTAALSLGAWRQANSQTTCGISIGTPFPLNNRAR